MLTNHSAQKGTISHGAVLFLCIGSIAFGGYFVIPVLKIFAARNWDETSCVILSSEVKTSEDADGDTHAIDIRYSYKIHGREYQAQRYQFFTLLSSGFRGKKAVVDRLPPGAETSCYVNPKDSTDAVIERGFTFDLFLCGGISLVFVLSGAFDILKELRNASDL